MPLIVKQKTKEKKRRGWEKPIYNTSRVFLRRNKYEEKKKYRQ